MTDETLAQEGTETSTTQTQVDKTYSQKEVDDMMARTKSAITKKVASKYEDLGDPDQIRDILAQHNKREQENAMKRGDFEKVLQDIASKKDAEIQKRDRIIEQFKLETPVIDAAARHRAVNPDQVKALVRNNLRLNGEGEVEVLDNEGKVRYDDSGRPLSVDTFVQSWLQSNPHFVQATPSTSASRSNVSNSNNGSVDISKLDMSNPEHRKVYAEFRKTQK
jgi:tyrosyl-tRNA synthetase